MSTPSINSSSSHLITNNNVDNPTATELSPVVTQLASPDISCRSTAEPAKADGCFVELELFLEQCVLTQPSSEFIARLAPSTFADSS
jgi:hypothetical protein